MLRNTGARISCPLCEAEVSGAPVRGADARRYRLCQACSLIFVEPAQWLSLDQERAYYGTHQNSIENAGYVRFLNSIVEPLAQRLSPGMRGLDFGCGPGPTLSTLVRRLGYECDDYDPLFVDCVLQPPYDFIFCTETFEHFHDPAQEIGRLHGLLRRDGLLGVMTERWSALDTFARWGYTRDPTHVVFFHADTFAFLERRYGFTVEWMDERRAAILRKL